MSRPVEEQRASRRATKVTASSGARGWQAPPGSKHVVCLKEGRVRGFEGTVT